MEYIELSRRSGETCTFLIRRCQTDDFADIMALQLSVQESLDDPELCMKMEQAEISESLQFDYCLGAYAGDELAAVTIMVVNRVSPRNYGSWLGYDDEKQRSCVSMDVTMVDPRYRGYGLQKCFVAMREEEARRLGATEAFVTISPDNTHSLRNFVSSGYELVETKPLYGDIIRSILKKDI